MEDYDLLPLARRLAGPARPVPVALERLTGGRNNRVFRVATEDGGSLLLKLYHADQRDTRDRLRAEWNFLVHAWNLGIRNVPEPLARDQAVHAGLYGFLPGRRLLAGEVEPWHVDAALDLALAINAKPVGHGGLDPGSEACFSIAEHIATIERRVARLAVLDPDAPYSAAADGFVRERLLPAWQGVRAALVNAVTRQGLTQEAMLPAEACCVSPSDFGFHNALVTDGSVAFIDFEYAGIDDPAKLAADFFCQPEVPVPPSLFGAFVDRLIGGLGLEPVHAERCRLLLDAYRIKWACIILNDFLPLGSARRAYADPRPIAARCAAQLALAETKLRDIAVAC